MVNNGTNKANGLAAVTADGSTPTPKTGVLDGVIMVIDKLIAIGQKIIPTIEKEKRL